MPNQIVSKDQQRPPLICTIPHSGEKIPDLTPWLRGLPEEILMCDIDRYVDLLYAPILSELQVPHIKTDWHRYAVDLNRVPTDIDESSVVGATEKAGVYARGYHWVHTTLKQKLMPQPMSMESHQQLTKLIYEPFHTEVKNLFTQEKARGFQQVYHIDLHSMPSLGTAEHRDPGEWRADIVISDSKGKSCSKEFLDLVLLSYIKAGFKVAYNWPYYGGRLTEQYGDPAKGQQTIQVELNRKLYMDEKSKKLNTEKLKTIQTQLGQALRSVFEGLQSKIT